MSQNKPQISQARKSKRVVVGNSHLTVYPWNHPKTGAKRWRVRWIDKEDRIRYITKRTKDEAEAAAEKVMKQKPTGLVWEGLPEADRKFLERALAEIKPGDREAVFSFVKSRRASSTVAEAVERFISWKIAEKGRENSHLKQVRRDLEALADAFPETPITDVHLDVLEAWFTKRAGKVGNARKNSLRGMLVMLWRWCRKMDLVGNDAVTVADKIPPVAVKDGTRFVYTPDEFMKLAAIVDPKDRAWIVLQAFAGLRPEEAAPKKADEKEPFKCEQIDWKFNVLRISDKTSKTVGSVVPLNDTLKAWLEWAGIEKGMTGPCCMRSPSELKLTVDYGRKVFGDAGWPADALRHSYGSYRNAQLRNLPHLAEEMRTSVDMLNKHYHNPRAEAEGEAWFALRPPGWSGNCNTEAKTA